MEVVEYILDQAEMLVLQYAPSGGSVLDIIEDTNEVSAPEILNFNPVLHGTDMWAVGFLPTPWHLGSVHSFTQTRIVSFGPLRVSITIHCASYLVWKGTRVPCMRKQVMYQEVS